MSEQLEALRQTNNGAVRLLQMGDTRSAYRQLQAGMKHASQTLSLFEDNNTTFDANSQEEEDFVGHESRMSFRIAPLSASSNTSTMTKDENTQEELFGLLSPFVMIPKEETMETPDYEAQLPVACAVFLFNLAVTCHRLCLASKSCRQQRQALFQAKKLYMECIEVLPTASTTNTTGNCEHDPIVVCALANLVNIAHEEANLEMVGFWYTQLKEAFAATRRECCDCDLYRRIFQHIICYSPVMMAARAA